MSNTLLIEVYVSLALMFIVFIWVHIKNIDKHMDEIEAIMSNTVTQVQE